MATTLEPREMDKLPYFRFFPARFLASELAVTLSNEELGAYLRLLLFSWINDGLPGDRKVLSRIAQLGGEDLERVLSSGFTTGDDDRLRSEWLEEERAWALDKSLKAKASIGVRVAQGGYAKKVDPEKEAKRKAILATYEKAPEEPDPDGDTDSDIKTQTQTETQTQTQTAHARARSKTSEERTKYGRNTNVSHTPGWATSILSDWQRWRKDHGLNGSDPTSSPSGQGVKNLLALHQREEHPPERLAEAARRYLASVKDVDYVCHFANFFGKQRRFEHFLQEDYQAVQPKDDPANIFGGSGMDDVGGL